MSTFSWTAEHDATGEQFGGTVQAEPVENQNRHVSSMETTAWYWDYRPVFQAAHREAVARHGDDVTVVEICWQS